MLDAFCRINGTVLGGLSFGGWSACEVSLLSRLVDTIVPPAPGLHR